MGAVLSVSVCLLGVCLLGCHKGADPIGLPDSYVLFVPAMKDGQVRRGPTGLPVLEALALDDSRAVPYHKLFSVGFAAELLRTDYLRKQFVRDAHVDGKAFAPTRARRQPSRRSSCSRAIRPSSRRAPGSGWRRWASSAAPPSAETRPGSRFRRRRTATPRWPRR